MTKQIANKPVNKVQKPKKQKIAKKKTIFEKKPKPAGQVTEWVQRLRDVGCKVDVPINIMLEWDSASDLDLWAKCMCTDRTNWIGYSNKKCNKCQIELDHDIQCGVDGRKPTPIEHIFFNLKDLVKGKKIEFYVHNYACRTKRPTNDFKLAAFNSSGQLIWPPNSNEPYKGTIKGTNAKTEVFSFTFDDSNFGGVKVEAPGTGVPLWDKASLKDGDFLSTVNYWKSVGGG